MKAIKAEIKGECYTLACEHWKTWPPLAASLQRSADELRALGMIDAVEHQRVQVWERRCGLKAMSGDKCPTCPHVLKVTSDHTGLFLTTLDGFKSSRVIDPVSQRALRATLQATYRPGTPISGANHGHK